MLYPVLFMVIFMTAITAPGLIALHREDKRAKRAQALGNA